MNAQLTQILIVSAKQTAESLGSGLLPVFSTPSLVAFMENTAMKLIDLPEGGSSVGTAIAVKHLKASKIGEELSCTATLTENEGRRYAFDLKVTDTKGDLVGEGSHERFVVDVQRFMSKLNG
jgi:predicted thioesterase